MISTLIIRYKLHISNKLEFDLWYEEMTKATRSAEGFIDRIELPSVKSDGFHSVVLRFENSKYAEKWMNSDIRKKLLAKANIIHFSDKQEIIHEDNDFWFNTDKKVKTHQWKEVIVSFVAVYPLTQIAPKIVDLIFTMIGLSSFFLRGAIIALIVSTLMVYLAMPIVLKVFKKWLSQ